MGFKFSKGMRCGYQRQVYIYAVSLNYKNLPEAEQKKIRELCKVCGHGNSEALFRLVTTEDTPQKICMEHHIASPTTLYRIKKEYYERFPKRL